MSLLVGDWEVHFGEYPAIKDEKYIVDIATSSLEFVRRIAGVISDSFPEIKVLILCEGAACSRFKIKKPLSRNLRAALINS